MRQFIDRNFWLLALAMSGLSLILSYGLYLLNPISAEPVFEDFTIEKEMGFRQIAEALRQQGLIRSAFMFKVYGALSGVSDELKAGNHWLSGFQSTPEILATLVESPATDKEVVIFEGMTIKEIDELLASQRIIRKGALEKYNWLSLRDEYPFLAGTKNLEGFLFPDTYRFYPQSSVEQVVRKILEAFQEKVWPMLLAKRPAVTAHFSNYEILTLASILEKEVPSGPDQQLVAGVMLKRLKIDMALQVDATICYAESKTSAGCYPLSRSDFDIKSPYNTYRNKGLPPGPISNPGVGAVKAAISPKIGPYLFYLSDPKTKRTIFSATFEEHNENRAKYLGL